VATNTQLVDGKQALDAQERALNFMEQVMFAKVTSYTKRTGNIPPGTAPNVAVLEDVPVGQQPKPLHLEAVNVGVDPSPTIAQQTAAGKTLAFQGTAFVNGNQQTVLGFR